MLKYETFVKIKPNKCKIITFDDLKQNTWTHSFPQWEIQKLQWFASVDGIQRVYNYILSMTVCNYQNFPCTFILFHPFKASNSPFFSMKWTREFKRYNYTNVRYYNLYFSLCEFYTPLSLQLLIKSNVLFPSINYFSPRNNLYSARQLNRPISHLMNNSNNYLAKFRFTAFYKQSAEPRRTRTQFIIFTFCPFFFEIFIHISSENLFFPSLFNAVRVKFN